LSEEPLLAEAAKTLKPWKALQAQLENFLQLLCPE